MLTVLENDHYRMKEGDTLSSVAAAYRVPECVLVGLNDLSQEPWQGFLYKLPKGNNNLYTVQSGDSKQKLCGSKQRYRELNFTDAFFIGMKIYL